MDKDKRLLALGNRIKQRREALAGIGATHYVTL
jgi:hypothetical protein